MIGMGGSLKWLTVLGRKQWDGLLLTPLRRQRAIMMSELNHHLEDEEKPK